MKTFLVVLVAAVSAVLQANAFVQAQTPASATPQATDTETMTVSGIAPVAPGASIVIEALDPVTIRNVECARIPSVAASDAPQGSSRFSLTVDRSCVRRVSGNLRVCWAEGKCQGIDFAPGRQIDLGSLTFKPSAAFPPDTGNGPDSPAAGSSNDTLPYALGASGLAVAALALTSALLVMFRSRASRHQRGA